jgi:hypothetical protein
VALLVGRKMNKIDELKKLTVIKWYHWAYWVGKWNSYQERKIFKTVCQFSFHVDVVDDFTSNKLLYTKKFWATCKVNGYGKRIIVIDSQYDYYKDEAKGHRFYIEYLKPWLENERSNEWLLKLKERTK